MSGMRERMLGNTTFENGIKSGSGCTLHGMCNSERNREIMKKVEYYICDFCGSEYDNKMECQECEKMHKTPVSIEEQQYNNPILNDWLGYPSILRVKMDDGEIIEYKRNVRQ